MGVPNFSDLDGTKFQDEMLRELPERYTFMDGLETVIEQNWMEHGAYRPHRFLPALNVSLQDQEGRVLHHGQIVSSFNLRTVAGDYNSEAGLDNTGFFYHAEGFNGPIKSGIDGIYGYDRTLDGVIVPCNATNAAVNDLVRADDVTIKRVLANGNVAANSDVGSTVALARPADMLPIGIIAHQTMRETHGANLSYRMETAAHSVMRYGVLKIPYVIADASRINAATTADTGYAAVYHRHQFLTIATTSLMKPEAKLRVDAHGKFILTSDTTTYPTTMGKVLSWTNDTNDDLRQIVDSYPEDGLNTPGTMTAGLDRRLFDFIKLIRTAQGQNTDIEVIKAQVDAGYYGYVKVMFNTTP